MFAIISIKAKQFKVTTNDLLCIDYINANIGDYVIIHKVLLIGAADYTAIGTPLVPNVRVLARVAEQSVRTPSNTTTRSKGYTHKYSYIRIVQIHTN